MKILTAIKREERKLEKQLGKLEHELSGVRAAAKALGGSAKRGVVGHHAADLHEALHPATSIP
jgi:hypothetical protein